MELDLHISTSMLKFLVPLLRVKMRAYDSDNADKSHIYLAYKFEEKLQTKTLKRFFSKNCYSWNIFEVNSLNWHSSAGYNKLRMQVLH